MSLKEKIDFAEITDTGRVREHNEDAIGSIGDIGLMGTKVRTEQGKMEEAYNVVLGGGVDDEQAIAREAFKGIPFRELPALLESILMTYLDQRKDRETFAHFTRRHDLETLLNLFQTAA